MRTPRAPWLTAPLAVWVGASVISNAGSALFRFALGWEATTLGGGLGGLVLAAGSLPSLLLALHAGAWGDRLGPRRLMLGCEIVLVALLVTFAGARSVLGPHAWLLATMLVSVAVVSAVQGPASAVFVRLFVPDAHLARAMAGVGTLHQAVGVVLPGIAGLAYGLLGATGSILADAGSFCATIAVLALVRPPREATASGRRAGTWSDIRSGLAAVRQVPAAGALLGGLALVAGGVLPTTALLVPLAAHAAGWAPAQAGLVAAAYVAGALVSGLLVAWRGMLPRAVIAFSLGLGGTAAGMAAFALGTWARGLGGLATAATGLFLVGLGVAFYTRHFVPLYVLQAPEGMTARFSSVLTIAQSGPQLAGVLIQGMVAQRAGVAGAALLAGGCCVAAAGLAWAAPSLRAQETSSN